MITALRAAPTGPKRSDRSWLVPLVLFDLYLLGTVVLALLKPGSDRAFLAYWDPIAVPIQLGATVTCVWYAQRTKRRSPWESSGWLLIGTAAFTYMLGDVVWTFYEVIRHVSVPTPSWADLFYVAFYLPLLAGTLCFLRPLSLAGRARLLLDSALVTSAAGILSWYYLVGPLWHQSQVSLLGKTVSIAYCLGDLAVLVCVIALVSTTRLTPGARLAMGTLAGGLLAMSVADAGYWLSVTTVGYQSGQWADLGWNVGCTLIACAPLVAARAAPSSAEASVALPAVPVRVHRGDSLHSILPYLLAFAAYAFVLIQDAQGARSVSLEVVLVGFAFMALVMVRQVLSYADSLQLYQDVGALNSRLAESNAELTEARQHADEMAEEAKAATEAKSRFLANMSHEIRTPLNGVVGMAGLLLRSELGEQQKQYTDTIVYSADLLLSLINDILDFSKIEAGMMQIEQVAFDLRDTLESVLETFAEQAQRKRLELVADLPLELPHPMVGDSHRLRQVLSNLIGNALKFTERGQVVLCCRWEATGDEGGVAHLSVQDSGPGIEADRLGRLFKSFSQADASTTRKHGGTGLGLAISRRLVELMGGGIGVESTPGQGTTFWFTVPFRTEVAAQSPTNAGASPGLSGARVILVADNAISRQVLQAHLGTWGISSVTAADGSEALGLLVEGAHQESPFHVALVDDQMPGMDGLELAQAIRGDPELQGIVLIVLTSIGSGRDRQCYRDLGVSRYLTKPVRQSALLDALMDALHPVGEPIGHTPTARVELRPEAPRLPRGLRILLAEDNETNQLVAQGILRSEGLQCDIAANGVEAVALATSRDYDLVLMDRQMPEMDGCAAARQIRTRAALTQAAHLPIIALTASATITDQEECLAAGMDDYLTKPVSPESLLAMVAKWAPRREGASSPETPASVAPQETGGHTDIPTTAVLFGYEAALARCAGDPVLLRKVVELLVARTPQELAEAEAGLARGDATVPAAFGHKLKGGAATVSAEALSVAAGRLEETGRGGSLGEVRECLEQVREEFMRFSRQAESVFAMDAVRC